MPLIRAIMLLSPFFAVSSAWAFDWVYWDPYKSPSEIMRITDSPRAYSHYDLVESWESCEKGSAAADYRFRFCILARSFWFGVPKTMNVGDEWTINGSKFRVELSQPLRLLGQSLGRSYVIQDITLHIRYLYSNERGLIGMYQITGGRTGIVMIQGRCGIGADLACYEGNSRPTQP